MPWRRSWQPSGPARAQETTVTWIELDFSTYIAERTEHFTGREWIVTEIERWLAGPAAPRTFLLTGDPGIGKTAFAAHLVRSRPEWLAAWHFCSATRGGWIDPVAFARSLASQLSIRRPSFKEALLRHADVEIEAHLTIGTLTGGQAVNVLIERLEVAGVEDAFNRLVRGPLQGLEPPGSPLVLLIDGLDEALAYGGPVSIADILARAGDLPGFVRLVLTSRDERRVLRLWDGVPHFRIHAEGERNLGDVRLYVERRLADLLGAEGTALRDRVVSRSSGNFLYVSYLVETLARQPELAELEDLPEGLDGIYRAFLSHRDIGRDPVRWEVRYLPVLGVLAVAREPLSEERVGQWTGCRPQEVAGALRDLWQYLSVEPGEEQRFRIYHRSFLDFLLDRSRSRDHWIDGAEWHGKIAGHYLGAGSRLDAYALQHLVSHLAGAGRHEALFALVDDRAWLDRKLELDPSGGAYLADVEVALGAAVRRGAKGLPSLIGYALLYSALADLMAQSLPRILAERVRQGEVEQAFEIASQIADPLRATAAYESLGRLLAVQGDPERARNAWLRARAIAVTMANPATAAQALATLASSLLAAGEKQDGDEVFQQAESTTERISEIEVRADRWIELAALADCTGRMDRVEALLVRAIGDMDSIPLEISFYDAGFHEGEFFLYFSGLRLKDLCLEKILSTLVRSGGQDWCLRLFEHLDASVESTKKRLATLTAEPSDITRSFPAGSVSKLVLSVLDIEKSLRSRLNTAQQQVATLREGNVFAAQDLSELSRLASTYPWGGSTVLRLDRKRFSREGGFYWLRTPYKSDPGAQHWRLETVQASAHLGRNELDRMARGDFEGALGLIGKEWNNEVRANLLMVLARQMPEKADASRGAEILEKVLAATEGMWAREEVSRVQGGVALAFLRLGHAHRALEVAAGIEYNDLRVEALAAMLRDWRAREDRKSLLLHAGEVVHVLDGLWAEIERVRGLIALAAALSWAGAWHQAAELLEQASRLAIRIPRPQRELRPTCFITPGLDWKDRDYNRPDPWVEEAIADLLTQGHGSKAMELVALLAPVLNIGTALRSMAAVALTKGDAPAYGKLLSMASELGVEDETLLESPPTNASDLVGWLGTAFQAARFRGREAVRKHVDAAAPFLDHIARDLPERVKQRLEHVESLLARSSPPEPS